MEFASGINAALRLWVSEGVGFGVGGETGWLVPLIQGGAQINADWHKPYWEILKRLPNVVTKIGSKGLFIQWLTAISTGIWSVACIASASKGSQQGFFHYLSMGIGFMISLSLIQFLR